MLGRPQAGGGLDMNAMGHELGHTLTNKVENGCHYKPEEPANRRLGPCNLMYRDPRTGDHDGKGVEAGKRLWDHRDGDQFNQVERIHGSPYLWR